MTRAAHRPPAAPPAGSHKASPVRFDETHEAKLATPEGWHVKVLHPGDVPAARVQKILDRFPNGSRLTDVNAALSRVGARFGTWEDGEPGHSGAYSATERKLREAFGDSPGYYQARSRLNDGVTPERAVAETRAAQEHAAAGASRRTQPMIAAGAPTSRPRRRWRKNEWIPLVGMGAAAAAAVGAAVAMARKAR